MGIHELCRFLAELPDGSLAADILEEIRYRTLDWLGCAVGALSKASSPGVLELVREAGGNPCCTAFGLPEKTSMYLAGFSNGILGHTLEYDDVNKIAIAHPGAVAIPAALAAAEWSGAPFSRFAAGAAAGYEVMVRLGAALNPSHYEYWHTTGTCGAFAAAAAAGAVMGLDAGGLERAFGLAGTMASGLVCSFGTDAKLVNVGNAVSGGLKAAVLADKGFSAPENVIERKGGYGEAVSRELKSPYLCPGAGEELMIRDSYYKLHASCGHTHSALDALKRIRENHEFTADQVESVSVKAYQKAVELTGAFCCDTELKAKFSMPYCIAAMLVYGEVGLAQFSEAAREELTMSGLRERIRILEDRSYTERYPGLRLERLSVKLKDGRGWEEEVELPEGRPSAEYIRKKFLSLAGLTVDEVRARRMMKTLLSASADESMRALGDRMRGELSGG